MIVNDRRVRRLERRLAKLIWVRRKWSDVPTEKRLRLGNVTAGIRRLRVRLEELARG